MSKRPIRSGLPTREQILEFIESSDQPAGKREIARAFGLKGQEKIALKQLLRDMGDEGLIDSARPVGLTEDFAANTIEVAGPLLRDQASAASTRRPPAASAARERSRRSPSRRVPATSFSP